MNIDSQTCRDFIAAVLRKLGAKDKLADRWAELLVETSLLGFDSHGVRMLERYLDHIEGGGIKLDAEIKVVSETSSAVCLDADAGLGHLAADHAVKIAVDKAKKTGVACVTVRNGNHVGACGLYTRMAALTDCVAVCSTVSRSVMAPWGGRKPLLGSNPVSIGAPIEELPPFLLDMATTKVAMGKIVEAIDHGQPIPKDWALDADGNPTTDPRKAFDGSLTPFGGHKGSGLAMAMEILTAVLGGGMLSSQMESWITQTTKPSGACFFITVMDVPAFQPVENFKKSMREFLDAVVNSPPRPGVDRIYYPGMKEDEIRRERLQSGIPLDEETTAMIGRIERKYSVSC